MKLYLIGYRCTGKSSVGKAVAEAMAYDFLDADNVLEAKIGQTIAQLVESKGWETFRDIESEVLDTISRQDGNLVIATGGGVILRPENVSKMQSTGTIIWLTARPDTIRQRLHQDIKTEDQRPGLTAKGASDEIDEVLTERKPLYKSAAHFEIPTDAGNITGIRDAILSIVKKSP